MRKRISCNSCTTDKGTISCVSILNNISLHISASALKESLQSVIINLKNHDTVPECMEFNRTVIIALVIMSKICSENCYGL